MRLWHRSCSLTTVKLVALTAVVGFIAGCAFCAEPNPRSLVSQSIVNYESDWNAALDFTYTEREVTKDSSGRAKSIELSQVSVFDGTPYARLIAKDGHPLSSEEARKEEEKYRRMLDARGAESPGQRDRRIRKYEEERRFLQEIPDAFHLKLLGEETLGGRSNYVIALAPKPDYVPKSKNARIFTNIEGKLWIDKQDLRWTQAEANVVGTISFGWVLARIGPGAHIVMKQVKVDSDHWMPKEIDVNGNARIMLVKNRTLDQVISYDGYKRVRAAPGTAAAKNR
jgi:hypothetical protein